MLVTGCASPRDFLYEALAQARGSSASDVRDELAATEGVIDSLEGIELVLAAEQAFGTCFKDDELKPHLVSSFQELARLVAAKLETESL